jgi:hypothetical protein
VLAGGDFPLLYENAGYPLYPNPFSTDSSKPFALRNSDKNAQDIAYFNQLSLADFRSLTPDTPSWWDGTRAMCAFVSAVADQLASDVLIPTRVSMVYGVAASLDEFRAGA